MVILGALIMLMSRSHLCSGTGDVRRSETSDCVLLGKFGDLEQASRSKVRQCLRPIGFVNEL